MKRIEFRLSMPSCGSWNGKWSGADFNYTIVRKFTDAIADKLMQTASWSHRWNDGWCANISARIVPPGERLKKSDGFSGYDWMVANIIDHGTAYEQQHQPEAQP
jgi:hypothetical protein